MPAPDPAATSGSDMLSARTGWSRRRLPRQATAMRSPVRRFLWIMSLSWLGGILGGLIGGRRAAHQVDASDAVEKDRADKDHADHDLLPVRLKACDHETVVEEHRYEDSESGAEDRSRPAEEAGAAEGDGRQHLKR